MSRIGDAAGVKHGAAEVKQGETRVKQEKKYKYNIYNYLTTTLSLLSPFHPHSPLSLFFRLLPALFVCVRGGGVKGETWGRHVVKDGAAER